jgi:hypothetical protein
MLSPAQQRPDATNYPHGPPSGRAISLVFAVGGSGGPHAPRSFSSISEDKTGGIVGFYSDKRKESESKQTKRGAPVCADATGRPLLYSFKGALASWSLFSFFAHGLKMIPQKVMEQPLVTPGTTVEGAEGVPLPPGSAAVRFAFS